MPNRRSSRRLHSAKPGPSLKVEDFMLRSADKLAGYKLGAVDGDFGKVKDFYFDDQTWTVRYLVDDTGGWLPGLQVLVSPFAVKSIDDAAKHINVGLTKQQ